MQFCGDSQPKKVILVEGKGWGDNSMILWYHLGLCLCPISSSSGKLKINLFWIIFVITLNWIFSLDTVWGSFSIQKLNDGGAGGVRVRAVALVFWGGLCSVLTLSSSSAGTSLCSMDTSQDSDSKREIIYHLNTFKFLQSFRWLANVPVTLQRAITS